jgi:hypothetical protein
MRAYARRIFHKTILFGALLGNGVEKDEGIKARCASALGYSTY